MNKLINDVRYAMRALARNYGFAAVTSLMLAFGLGLVSFMFTAINGFWLIALPFPEPERILHVELARPALDQNSLEVPWPDWVEYERHQTAFETIGAFYGGTVNLSADDRPERFDGAFLSAGAFDVLGVKPLIGRTFLPGEDQFGAPLVAVIGFNTWQLRFLGDPQVVGRTVRINGRDATIVGVMPEGFKFPFNNQIWVPMQRDPAVDVRGNAMSLEVFGRLAPGATAEKVRGELGALLDQLARDFPATNEGLKPVVKPYKDEFVGDFTKRIVLTMFVACCLVLLIACANVANMVLVRTIARTRELAVRTALGASRFRLVLSVLSETLVMALIGATLGLAIAHFGVEMLNRALEASEDPPPYFIVFQVDWRVITFAYLAAVVTAIIAGIAPALRASQLSVNEVIKDSGRGSPGQGLSRLTRSLVIGEIALSCVLLVAAGLTVRSTLKATELDMGADISGILTGRVGLFEQDYPTIESRQQFFLDLERQLAEVPGVTDVAITTSLPLGFLNGTAVLAEGQTPPDNNRYPFVGRVTATPGTFTALRSQMLAGRNFTAADRGDTELVAIVNPAFVETYLKGTQAVGARVRVDARDPERARSVTIVGVVEHIRHEGEDLADIDPIVYLPLAQDDARFASFAVRTQGDPYALSAAVREAVRAVDPDLPIYWLRTLEDWLDIALFDHRLIGVLFGIFAAFALLLGAAGIYAVLAYSVAQRTREIGVRRALGAQDQGILHMVLGQGGRQLIFGLGIGLPLAVGFAQLLSNVLIDVRTFDPLTYVTVLVALAVITLLACVLPAWRAVQVHPMEALRYE